MKRFLLLLTVSGLLMTGCAAAEETASGAVVFAPEVAAAPVAAPAGEAAAEGDVVLDFANLELTDPAATPVAVDPIDKPTPTPAPTPNFAYEQFTSDALGVSFSVPFTWLLNPNTNQDTTIQFVEPKSEMRDVDGYQTRLTVEKVNMGLKQTAEDARDRLETTLAQLESTFTTFSPGNIASAQIGDAKGYYCYYKATYEDGSKVYNMRGRVALVAHDKALYQVRITTPQNWYSYYEYVFRKVRSTFKFN